MSGGNRDMQGYVNNLEELEKRIISPLKASSHSFISEKEVGVLFSNLESITCLNIQVHHHHHHHH